MGASPSLNMRLPFLPFLPSMAFTRRKAADGIRWPIDHGARQLPGVTIESCSLELRQDNGFVGDAANHAVFSTLLATCGSGSTAHELAGPPQGRIPECAARRYSSELPASRGIALAAQAYGGRLARVTRQFLAHDSWQGVRDIVVGGGLSQHPAGRLAIEVARRRLATEPSVRLRLLHHHPDDAGLVGWAALGASPRASRRQAMLAIAIGGTHFRCGVVSLGSGPNFDGSHRVLMRDKLRHAQAGRAGGLLLDDLSAMVARLVRRAADANIAVGPLVGISCSGVFRLDGSIERGAQNLPRSWQVPGFNLVDCLEAQLPKVAGRRPVLCVHNDAVVQGLSELPFMPLMTRYAVVTIGTGFGNAALTRLPGTLTRAADTEPGALLPVAGAH